MQNFVGRQVRDARTPPLVKRLRSSISGFECARVQASVGGSIFSFISETSVGKASFRATIDLFKKGAVACERGTAMCQLSFARNNWLTGASTERWETRSAQSHRTRSATLVSAQAPGPHAHYSRTRKTCEPGPSARTGPSSRSPPRSPPEGFPPTRERFHQRERGVHDHHVLAKHVPQPKGKVCSFDGRQISHDMMYNLKVSGRQ